ncbi:cytochrome b-c1 complex subunit 7-like [Mizuhopecten yessoensis]|uniref:Cytochrome b-c1 complex subunit 7 n=1 Tax=Mizuhopecten yessoensis TaxID=6573 RepID=A0A210QWB9_MIZYE|nr:cytochrome b-c1 complex subunit 7-like [Mizuhopecten yessoensis]XP_021347933.1 cytochrome b-c1 complex subunit 7-like [Mizuhopecten yessoensis]OWF53068.1 Cytochrome b-c1 complex subunit 7 [Mizuhopecten yessoensis]
MSAGTVSRVTSSALKPSKIKSTLETTKNVLVRVLEPPNMLKKIYFKFTYYPKLGLNTDDCLKRNYYAKGVLNEAVQRLPTRVQEERQFRISRAVMHSGNKTIPKKGDTVRFGRELKYMDEAMSSVIRDIEIRKYWDLNGEQPPESVTVSPGQYREGLQAIINNMTQATETK